MSDSSDSASIDSAAGIASSTTIWLNGSFIDSSTPPSNAPAIPPKRPMPSIHAMPVARAAVG
ncbi:hypothetical protein D3C72_1888090 [compost metagenome]